MPHCVMCHIVIWWEEGERASELLVVALIFTSVEHPRLRHIHNEERENADILAFIGLNVTQTT